MRGNRTKRSVVKSRMGTDSRHVVARKPRPTTRRLRRMRGHVDGQPRAIARALAVVALDLAPQMAEHERAGRDDQEPEEAEAVGQAPAEHRSGDEVQQGQHDDLLVVGRAASGREADDLQERRELDGDVEREATGEEASAFDDQEYERRDGREVAQGRAPLPALRDGDREREPPRAGRTFVHGSATRCSRRRARRAPRGRRSSPGGRGRTSLARLPRTGTGGAEQRARAGRGSEGAGRRPRSGPPRVTRRPSSSRPPRGRRA